MVVDNLYLIGVSVSPDEADSPLVVYPYAVLPLALAGQSFKPIPRRDTKVLNRCTSVQHSKLPEGEPLD
jgi:hypothetical protein